jgi:hypothetical protein
MAQSESIRSGCPVHGQSDVQATVSDMREGVAITFSAQQREVDGLRSTLHAMDEANSSRGDPFALCPCIYERGATASQPMSSNGAARGSTYGSEPMPSYGTAPGSSYGASPGATYGAAPGSSYGTAPGPSGAAPGPSYGGNPAYGAFGGNKGEPMMLPQGRSNMQPTGVVPADTSVEDTPTGGVLRLRAKDPAQVQALRDQVRENVMAMQRGCVGSR